MRKLTGLLALALLAALALGGCSSDDNGKSDGGGKTPDGGPTPDASAPTALDCAGGNCKDFVFDSLRLPASSDDAKKYGVDFNKDGTPDNQLGQILSALGNIVPDLALQGSVDEAVNGGKTIILVRVQAADFASDPKAAAQAWLGQEAACCTDADPVKCATETKTTCYKGDFEFKIDPASPKDAIFGGAISSSKGTFGPATLKINLPLSTGQLNLTLQKAQFVVTFSGDKITDAKLAGGISEQDLNDNVLPSVHNMLQNTVETSDGKTKDQVLQLFDTDDSGDVSLEEVRNNDIIKAFLQGDVDVDGDGTLELSLGVGFTAVSAKISE